MDMDGWLEQNQRSLAGELASVRRMLGKRAGADEGPGDDEAAGPSPAMDALCAAFGLSGFERNVLLLCAGMEMDSRFGPLCAAAQGVPSMDYPTFSLALSLFPGPHWSALTPMAALRYWMLVEVGEGETLVAGRLRIDERALHYLAGINNIDRRLAGAITPLYGEPDLLPSHRDLAERLAAALTGGASRAPLIQLRSDDAESMRDIALTACRMVGLNLCSLSWLPPAPEDLEEFIRLWQREVILGLSALLVDLDDEDPQTYKAIRRLAERIDGPLVIVGRERRRVSHRSTVALDMKKPVADERSLVWRSALGKAAETMDGGLDALASRFDFNAMAIRGICEEALASGDGLETALWESCRACSRPKLEGLSQRIEPAASWDDLVLPGMQMSTLREIAAQVRWRSKVYDDWGFASKGSRGLGISALFAGASGTGKTMAAEVLANELKLDLYRIDLSQVVNKYIGETEKNLRRVFDAAEEGCAVLLFDEADALFGKRSEVKDSHDRYANIEISYLLQRMESYRGLAILTTNMKSALDAAFLRRIRFVVEFPYPDTAMRAQIWKRVIPAGTPTEGIDADKLARLNVAGGNIRNIAMNAAFIAADAGEPLKMRHLLHAAQREYAKMEKPLTESETRGWI